MIRISINKWHDGESSSWSVFSDYINVPLKPENHSTLFLSVRLHGFGG